MWKWDNEKISNDLILSNNGMAFTKTGNEVWSVVFSEKLFVKGSHCWSIKLVNFSKDNDLEGIIFGMAEDSKVDEIMEIPVNVT